ncbi:High-affinity methionine permease [Psilocybe cubensis]|uniref:High-affinity methionine permease n=2 Tax=Psilocybe cubensis TaxID=181762 RepID=A0A8H8CDZ1_PSICU|nr:High-affinity methionine permease [Psilocybe cubensis]KAH9481926.1 High-affinity methionine permease [Psilocybe cubensis]
MPRSQSPNSYPRSSSDTSWPLLRDSETEGYGSLADESVQSRAENHPKRQIGVVSAVFIIFNRIIGTGIFATPSTILGFSGSVGLSLVMWIIGAVIAAAGMQVYIIWGTALPQNGGEKNYLEHLFPKPRRLITSIYAANAVLLAYAAGNCLVFAEYAVASISPAAPASTSVFSPVRVVAFLCLTGVLLLHGLHIPSGLRLQNLLGFFKIGILLVVVMAGCFALGGNLQEGVVRPGNFDSWAKIWEGSRGGRNVLCACLYNVIWSYIGFSNANYALAEMRDPARTLRIAGPLAIVTVTVFYLFCNIAYFAAASKEEITGSGRLVAALLFRNVWGPSTERILNIFIAMSALGNVLSVSFSQGRVNQTLGAEGILPFSKFWASSWPAKAPLAGLSLHWAVCNLVIFNMPPGDAYNFVLNLCSYPLSVINTIISFGLLYLSLRRTVTIDKQHHDTDDHTTKSTIVFKPTPSLILPTLLFGIANVFLFVVPLTKPPPGVEPYEKLPYWLHGAGGWCIFLVGGVWWLYYYHRRPE